MSAAPRCVEGQYSIGCKNPSRQALSQSPIDLFGSRAAFGIGISSVVVGMVLMGFSAL
jgi:hypothetical protein